MENRGIVAILLVISAFLGFMGYMQEQTKQYNAAMNVAVTNYIKANGPEAKMVKITVHDKETAVATYDIYGQRCETHVVHALTKPTEGLFGTMCSKAKVN